MSKFLPLLAIFIFTFCNNNEQLRTGELVAPVCTGFNYVDGANVLQGKVGLPNNNLISSDKQFRLYVYPIPSSQSVNVLIDYNGIKQAWLTRAQVSTELNQSLVYFNSPIISIGGGPVISIDKTTDVNFRFDASTLPKGYYRLYVKTANDLLWENLIIN
jgi:hypothetical protein